VLVIVRDDSPLVARFVARAALGFIGGLLKAFGRTAKGASSVLHLPVEPRERE
jgi:hypothetical protein